MTEYKGIMIYCDVADGKLMSIATELLGGGRKLAEELDETLIAAIIGQGVSDLSKDAIAFGADKVYLIEDQLLKEYQTEPYVTAIEKAVKAVGPRIILMGQTEVGRDLAPRLAFRLGTSANLGCIELGIDSDQKKLLQTKPVYGGNAQAVFISETDPQIATVRSKVLEPLERDESRQGEVENIEVDFDESKIKTKVVERVEEDIAGVKLEDAEIIVAGGRGIGGAENFKQLEELASLLKGAVGASRPPCDDGWVPSGLQIGITGKTVTPELYIAVGISGAPQHVCGAGSKHMVAINKDPDANIFNEAQYGIVGDWKKVLPAFTEKLKELLN